MKMKRTLLFCISLLVMSFSGMAQEQNTEVADTLKFDQKYGLRIGLDLAKPARTLLEEGYSGFEIMGDFRITDQIFAAAELGNEEHDWNETNLQATTKGSYIKIGADLNAYKNWLGMNNAIFGGLRYGFSTFQQQLDSYTIVTTNPTFPSDIRVDSQEFKGLTASWVELIVGIKTEIYNNLFLSVNLQLKRQVSETAPENFDNLYIPGFNRTYDFSEFGVGYGYTISYLIPIFKK